MSLLVWLPLNGDLTNNGVSKIQLKNNGATIENNGKLGKKCYYLNGKTLTYHGFTALNNTSEYSACCWVKFTTFPSGSQSYCISVNNAASNSLKFILGIVSSDGTTAKFRINANSKSDIGTLQLNTWYHLAVCISNTTGYMYINGELVKTVTSLSQTASNNLVIGGRSSNAGATSFAGLGGPAYYNDVRIYNHCLSPREVKQISQGLVMHYALNNSNNTNMLTKAYTLNGKATLIDEVYGFPYLSGDNTSGTSYKNIYNEAGFPVTTNEVYTASFWARSSTSTPITLYFYNNTSGVVQVSNIKSSDGQNKAAGDGNCSISLTPMWNRYWVTWTFNSSGTSANKELLFRLQAGNKADIALVKLEKGSIATPFGLKASELPNPLVEKDLSGYGNDGVRSIALPYVSCDKGRYSNATSFVGGTRVRCSGKFSTEGQSDLTLAAWVYPINTANGADINTIIIGGAYLAIETSTNKVTTYCYGKSPAGYNDGKTALPLNQWSHIAAVWDGINGTHKIYINGIEDLSITCTGLATSGSQGQKDIGRENDNSRTFNGLISDARIYMTALSANDIKTLATSSIAMLETGQIQGYEFNEDFNKLKLNQNGSVDAGDISEIGYLSGMKIKVLPEDKSAWARIYWLDLTNDTTIFSSSDVNYSNQSNRFSRLSWIDHFKTNLLPKGYTKLNYIESTGNQYIDTGYYWTSETVQVIMDAYITSNASNQSLFGNEEPYEGSNRYFAIIPHGSNGSFSMYAGTGSITTVSTGLETRFTLDCSTNGGKLTTKLNGTQISSVAYSGTIKTYVNSLSTDASKGKIYIFANHNSKNNGASPTQNIGGMRLYSFKMYDNGIMVRNFIPCKNSSGEIGLYDMVYGNFYKSPQGTAFSAGSEIANRETDSEYYEFMLTLPQVSSTGFNRWQQTNSPNSSQASGLKKIKTTWSNHSGALIKVTNSKYTANAVYATNTANNWWSPIGQTTLYEGTGIPGTNGANVKEIELWVRIDNLPKLNKISMLNDKYIQAFEIKEN